MICDLQSTDEVRSNYKRTVTTVKISLSLQTAMATEIHLQERLVLRFIGNPGSTLSMDHKSLQADNRFSTSLRTNNCSL